MSPGMATRHARCVRHDSQERANARGFHEEARHCQARKRERLQFGANVRPGFHPHSRWRHLVDTVLHEVRSWRPLLALFRPRRPAAPTRSRRERGVRRSLLLRLLSTFHRKIQLLLVAGAYR